AAPGTGPRSSGDESFRARFAADDQPDLTAEERDAVFVILGAADRSAAAAQARQWVARSGARSAVVGRMAHTLQRSPAGLERLVAELVR
ncbi:MAG: hypothetical protein L0221_04225, partial [Chloroflexi bacterium]|nr:hypothetical protein [Chloroflexota bacterium]